MSGFAIEIRDTTATPGVAIRDLGPIATGVRMTTTHPGGCAEMSFRVYAPTHFVPNWVGFNYEVRALAAGRTIWSGRMEDAQAHRGDDGEYWDVIAQGYGVNLDDQWYTSQNVQNVLTSTIVSDALTNLAPQITRTSVTASGFTISNVTAVNLQMMTAAAAIVWADRYGDSNNDPQIWYIYPDEDGTSRFTFKPRPTVPDITLWRGDCITSDFGFNGRSRANRVVVQYNAGASFVTVNDTVLQGVGPAGWNVTRTRTAVLPEITQSVDATQAANALLEKFSSIRMEARNLTLMPTARILDSNGQRVEPYLVRAGQLCKFNDVEPSGVAGGLSFNNSFLIAGTSYEEDTQTLTITPESYEQTLDAIVAQMQNLLTGRLSIVS